MWKSFVFVLASFSCTFGIAQTPDDAVTKFQGIDSNADASLSKSEFKKYVNEKLPDFKPFDELFSRLDADKNSGISIDEFRKRRPITQRLIDEGGAAAKKTVEFADGFNARYLTKKPLIGDSFTKLTAFDELGNEFDFKNLNGKYTVINFGCLT